MRNIFLKRTRDAATPKTARRSTATPGWVKVFVLIGILLVLLLVILHLTGNGFGEHMHMEHGGHLL